MPGYFEKATAIFYNAAFEPSAEGPSGGENSPKYFGNNGKFPLKTQEKARRNTFPDPDHTQVNGLAKISSF